MRPEADEIPTHRHRFDELAGFSPGVGEEGFSLNDTREAADLLGRVCSPAQSEAASRRVHARLFSAGAEQPRVVSRSAAGLPGWLRVAAAVALLVTGSAMYRADPPAPELPGVTTLIFPGQAIIDARVARLETELASLTQEDFWELTALDLYDEE